jgi:hypothetical protein
VPWARFFPSSFAALGDFGSEASGDDFRDVKYLQVVALGLVGGVAKHDRTVRASNHDRRCLGFGELRESQFVHPLLVLVPSVVSDKKLRAASSAALRILAMVRSFGE